MKLILSKDPSLYSVSIDRENPETDGFSFEAVPMKPPRPSGNDTFLLGSLGPSIAGSCRGLLCLNYPQCTILWNPSTRTHHKLHEPEDDLDFQQRKNWRRHVVQGLGYDEVNDDYKLVRVYQYLGPPNGAKKFDTKVLVYSLETDSWKRVPDFPYFVHFRTITDVFVNGALHFHVSTKRLSVGGDDTFASDCIIAAFDVCSHTYKDVSPIDVGEKYTLELGVLGGALSLIRNYDFGMSECMVMKEYGANSSWTPLFCVEMDASRRFRFRPISYVGGGRLVLLEAKGRIFCFNVETKSFRVFEIDGINQGFEIFVSMESGVVLGSVRIDDKIATSGGRSE